MGADAKVAPSLSDTEIAERLAQYECGPVQFTGTGNALYERHLMFDSILDPAAVGPREHYEAIARSVRDVLSQRWLRTEQTYERENPKRVYYLSMEFLLGRSLSNNLMNLRLGALAQRAVEDNGHDWFTALEQEPDAGLGNGGLGRLAACFIDSMATLQLPAMGYGLRYEYGIFKQTILDGWQLEQPDNWLRLPDPWEVARPHEQVEVKLGCSFEVRGGTLAAIRGKPSSLLGIPFDRPVIGYGGQTINTLRLWAAAAPNFSTSKRSAPVSSSARWPSASLLNPRHAFSIPTIPRAWARGCASCRSISWSAAHWRTWCDASVGPIAIGARCPRKSPSS